MKIEDATAPATPASASVEAFKAFFETMESPAALCDVGLTLLAANPAFEGLCGARGVAGKKLADLLEGPAPVLPNEGDASEVEVSLHHGVTAVLTLTRRRDTVAVRVRQVPPASSGEAMASAGRALLEQARVEQASLQLGREVAEAASEEELVAALSRGVKALFPGRCFCLRITSPGGSRLTSVYADGVLRPGASEVLVVKRSAADKTHLKTKSLPHDRVQITEREVPLLFEGTVRAVCAPLVASGQLFGMITLEYPEGLAADLLADDRQLIQLANQVAVGVRNAKLIEELTFMRKRLEDLVEHANALILVVDRERRVVMFNRALERATGLSKDRVLGRDLLTLAPESEGLRLMRVTGASLRGEEVPRFETRLLGQDGQEIRVSFATSTLLKPNGAVEGVIAIGQDLTATKELERRIIQAEKLASLGQLAASVVHEINNPMTAVATYADSLLQAWTLSAPPSDVEKLRKIMGNADRILRFTRDLVSYARPAQDRPAEVNLHQIIDLAAGFCDHELAAHRITVVREFDTLPPILAVKGDLIQVFVNLITNACHAMPQGGTLRLATVAQGARVAVRIQDEGTGIDPRNRERIFEPFFTTKPDGKGTGLGLSIVEDLVEKHGGDLEVESEMGVGTTFTIRLPVNVPAE